MIDSWPEVEAFMSGDTGSENQRYRFGPFEADAESGELRKHGLRIRLREQPFQVLLMLLERPGEVVLREEIRLKLWHGNTAVDFDHGINTAVKRLRDALGETAAEPRHVETVGRRGYRFLGEVEGVGRTHRAARALRPRAWWAWAAVAAGLVAAAAGWLAWRAPQGGNEPPVPITTYPGVAGDPSFSPDGSRIAFSWGGDEQRNIDIYIRQVGSSGLQRLTTDPAADTSPAWSPDDRYIAFVRSYEDRTAAILVIPPLGGAERRLRVLGPRIPMGEVGAPAPISWTPDGRWLAVADRDSAGEPRAIWLISIDTGERRRLTSPPDPAVADSNPSVSPDGRWLAVSRGRVSQYAQRPHVLPLTEGWKPGAGPQPLRAAANSISGIAWASPKEIVYSGGGGATGHLWRVDVSGQKAPIRLGFSEDALSPSISAGSHRLAYAWRIPESHIWRLDTVTGERQPLIVARGVQAFPHYSPDGKRIAFASTRGGDHEIWTCDAGGAHCVQMTAMHGPQTGAPHWSPDGRWLAFDSRPEGLAQIYKLRADGGTPARLSSGQSNDFTPSWSPDGRWIYFASDRTGRAEIWKMPAEGGPATQLTMDGGLWPEATADGESIYYAKIGRPGLFQLPAGGGEEKIVIDRLPFPQAWALTARGLYFFEAPRDGPQEPALAGFRYARAPVVMRFQEFGASASKQVAEVEAEHVPNLGMCVSPDGRFVAAAWFQTRGDVMLVERFR
jgi:Tol biopolymer transport system component/DNA-binding winged helix-turn-helix (wHTH) protein